WRDESAWARAVKWCRRWRSATGRPGGRKRGVSSTSCARRRAGIANMRCVRSGDTRRRTGSMHRERQAQVRRDHQGCADGTLGSIRSLPLRNEPTWSNYEGGVFAAPTTLLFAQDLLHELTRSPQQAPYLPAFLNRITRIEPMREGIL